MASTLSAMYVPELLQVFVGFAIVLLACCTFPGIFSLCQLALL